MMTYDASYRWARLYRYILFGVWFGLELTRGVGDADAAIYYINDGSTNGNVYTTAVGRDANSGTNAATPKLTFNGLFSTHVLGPGDVVYIDTGTYTESAVLSTNHAGVSTNRITLVGSTNRVAGGTTIRSPGGVAFSLSADHVEFKNLVFRDSTTGVAWSQHNIRQPQFERVSFISNTRGMDAGMGVGVGSSRVVRCLFVSNSVAIYALGAANQYPRGFFVDHSVFWSNTVHITSQYSDTDTIHNSVVVGGTVFNERPWMGDHNVFWGIDYILQKGGSGGSDNYLVTLDDLQRSLVTNFQSVVANPQFANPGQLDFHPRSLNGRFDPVSVTWTTDTVHSILIDFGGPLSTSWTNESLPNGGRLNVGLHGGTSEASLSTTNSWLQAISYSDGGTLYFTNNLYWSAGGSATNGTVTLSYSRDDGATWLVMATNVAADARRHMFDASSVTSTPIARWRVTHEDLPGVASTNTRPFAIRGVGLVSYYVNDAWSASDLYTTVSGHATNNGATPASPAASLVQILTNYTLRGDHIVYVDSGVYPSTNIHFTSIYYGTSERPVVIQGSTNIDLAPTVLRGGASSDILRFSSTAFLLFRDLVFNGGSTGVNILDRVVNCTFEGVRLQTNTTGIRVWGSQNNVFNRCILRNNSIGLNAGNFATGNRWDHGLAWSNSTAAFSVSASFLTVSNTIIVGGTAFPSQIPAGADHLIFWNTTLGGGYSSLAQLQNALGRMTHSAYADPMLIDPGQGNFYPKSSIGRYQPASGTFSADGVFEHSPVIDFGNATSTLWTNETTPNGGRINVGPFGGTERASRSRTNAWLLAMSMNDGGQVDAGVDTLRWNFGQVTGQTVRIEYSGNSGDSWSTVATNINAEAGAWLWTVTNFPSSRFARWRVVLESDPAVYSVNVTDFTFKNGPFLYYINDSETDGDLYSEGPGNDANLGTTPDLPKASLTNVLANYTLSAGDVVYVDTGLYESSASATFSAVVQGTNGNPVMIVGSTNGAAGGTILRGPASGGNGPAFVFSSGSRDITIRDVVIQRRTDGVQISGAQGIALERLRIESNSLSGVTVSSSSNIVIRNVLIHRNSQQGLSVASGSRVALLNSVVWNNSSNALLVSAAHIGVTNSVLMASGGKAAIYNLSALTNVSGNYNCLVVTQQASVAKSATMDRLLNTLGAWQAESGMDKMSLDADPQFVNTSNGDFHVRSQTIQGRFDPVLGWVTDTVTSPLIDAGDPSFAFNGESAPNGGRINIGLYGNAPEASRADLARLFTRAFNQGGYAKGTSTLSWVAGGSVTGGLVSVEVSLNGGASWMMLSTGVLASAEQFGWVTTTNGPLVACLWRVTSLDDPGITRATTNFFGLRNTALTYYVNDAATSGDQFTGAPGAATNWVATTNQPLDSLARLVNRFDLEPGDRIYMDSGTYAETNGVVWSILDSGALTSGAVTVIGATTCAGGVTPAAEIVWSGGITQTGLSFEDVSNLSVSNLTLRPAGSALRVLRGQSMRFSGLRVQAGGTNSVVVQQGSNIVFRNSLIESGAAYGFVSLTNTSTRLINSVLVSNRFGEILISGGELGVTNSVLMNGVSGASLYTVLSSGRIRADYNNLRVSGNAVVAMDGSRLHRFPATWQAESTNDLRSLSHEPGFADAGDGDYHLVSTVGRYDAVACLAATDSVDSILLDAGAPGFSVGDEPGSNGGRINLGLYGGTVEASQSTTNARLLTLTLNSGGTMRGTNTLYWYANAAATSHLVSIDISLDDGATWTNVASGLTASTGSWVWDSGAFPSSPQGRWRITSETDSSIASTTTVAFTLNNGAISYYVNDASTDDDVYASGPGSALNDGLSAGTPVLSINDIFHRYEPAAGDIVYVDTGNYTFTETLELDANRSGSLTNPVVIQGSTNWVAGGSRFNMNRSGPLISMENMHSYAIRALSLTNAKSGLLMQLSSNVWLERITVQGIDNLTDQGLVGAYGLRLESADVRVDRLVIANMTNRADSAAIMMRRFQGTGNFANHLQMRNSVLWGNTYGFWDTSDSLLTLSNSVVAAEGESARGFILTGGATFRGDYNLYRMTNGARLAEMNQAIYNQLPIINRSIYFSTLSTWREHTGQDGHTLTYYPDFANPVDLDFHPLSQGGRWTDSGVVTDAVTSVLIDRGDPVADYAQEPDPNGARVNIGVMANDERASGTPTNRSLVLLSYNDGGVVRGTNVILRWDARGDFSGLTFEVSISENGGGYWLIQATGLSASVDSYAWNSTTGSSGFNRMWRVRCDQESGVSASSELPFSVRNDPMIFYVNDGSTNGDVYAVISGDVTNSGLSVSAPLPSLTNLLDRYEVLGGDTIYVDTGLYTLESPVLIEPRDFVSQTGMITIIGSTNILDGGSMLSNGGFNVRNAANVSLSYFNVSGIAPAGVSMNASSNIIVEWIMAAGSGHGISLENTVQTAMRHNIITGSRTNGLHLSQQVRDATFDHGVIWTNGNTAVMNPNNLTISNSVLAASGSGKFIYLGSSNSSFKADYNAYQLMNLARLGGMSIQGETFSRQFVKMASWRAVLGLDAHSLAGDPLLEDPSGHNFHPQSTGGRWSWALNDFEVDAVDSPLLDAGAPLADIGGEVEPNGARINIGCYGGTEWASKTPANSDIVLVSLDDGGSVSGTNVPLSWVVRGDATGHTVRVEYSLDGGAGWTVLASNVTPGASTLSWNTTGLVSTVIAVWRVTSEDDPLVTATSAIYFSIRNGPVYFYVNDAETDNDVYTLAPGSSAANGATPSTPKDSVADILAAYELMSGDVLYVDTGAYTNTETVVIDQLDAGFTLRGSTNLAADGSTFFLAGATTGILLEEAPGTRIEYLRFVDVSVPVELEKSSGVELYALEIKGAGTGFSISASDDVQIGNTSIRSGTVGLSLSASSGLVLEHLVLWSNQTAAVSLSGSSASLINSVIMVHGTAGAVGVSLDTLSTWSSDYNLYWNSGPGLIARRSIVNSPFGFQWDRVATWSRDTGNDRYSLAADPLFVNAVVGHFYPRSEAGRFDVTSGVFVADTVTSPLLDAGSPQSSYTAEGAPNGSRANIGLYGNTALASRSPTSGWFRVTYLDDGGRAEGPSVPLSWIAGGVATGHTVRLDYSPDNGSTWSLVASNVPANSSVLYWNTQTNAGWLTRWRLTSEQDASIAATNRSTFALRNASLALYVNDTWSSNDVYTTASGNDESNGVSPSTPRASIQSLLDAYDLEPGDTLYVDTGDYILSSAISIGRVDAWNAMDDLSPLAAGDFSLRLRGSTNTAAGGSVLRRNGSGTLMTLDAALGCVIEHLDLRHVTRGAGAAVSVSDSPYTRFSWIRQRGATTGLLLDDSHNVAVNSWLGRDNTTFGISVQDSTNVTVRQTVLWSNTVGLAVANQGVVNLRNSVVVSLAADSVGIQRNDGPAAASLGILDANNNLYFTVSDAYIGEMLGSQYPGGRRRVVNMFEWAAATGQDTRSLQSDPMFVDPVAGDFHPRSPVGRFETGTGYITNALDTFSPLIDTGDSSLSYANETIPNGQRVNTGLYGNTAESSLSPSNGTLQLLTFRDGGSGNGVINLRWSASGTLASQPMTLDFSNDGGMTWTNIASNVLGSAQTYVWDSEPYGRAAAGLWRIYSQVDPSVASTNEEYFALRQGGVIPYYINDGSLANDLYTTAIGSDANTGFLPSTPKATLQSLLDDIDLEPGDIVYMDTGTYSINLDTEWGEFDGGVSTNPVILRGSTNLVAGGTVMNRITGLGSVLTLSRVGGVTVRDMKFTGGANGLSAELCQDIVLQRVLAVGNHQTGVRVAGSAPVTVQHSILWNNFTNGVTVGQFAIGQSAQSGHVNLFNNTIWGSRYGLALSPGGSASATNNLIRVDGPSSRIYQLGLGLSVNADYNAYYRINSSLIAERSVSSGGNEFFTRLQDWQNSMGQDAHSLSHNPQVVNSTNGDFHVRSATGRTLPSGALTNDATGTYSPLLDTGDPALAWDEELTPNGQRSNIGRYGNTSEASLSRTNGWLLALTLNDGGLLSGVNTIRWAAGNWATSVTVRLEYAQNGFEYIPVATNLPVYTDAFSWNVGSYPPAQQARWRVVSEDGSETASEVGTTFVIKNEPLVVYVNDNSTDGDMYTFAEGNATNSGLTSSSPLRDPGTALEKFFFSAGDTIYIDTGTYTSTNAAGLRLGLQGDSLKEGAPGSPIRIVGSTNLLFGGTTILPGDRHTNGLHIFSTRYVEVENMIFSGFTNGVAVESTEVVSFSNITVSGCSVGLSLVNAISAKVDRCISYNNFNYGLDVDGAFSSVVWNHGIIWSNGLAAVRHINGPLSISNSILGGEGSNAVIFQINGTLAQTRYEYNIYFADSSEIIMKDTISGVLYGDMRTWQKARGCDLYSVRVNPMFADPALGDFHLKSDGGRYSPAFQNYMYDTETSWAIDAGAPSASYAEEPEPNGDRLNVGLYGNNGEASFSTTNPGLFVVSLRDGGTAASPQTLYWLTRGLETDSTVRIEYTPNDGIVWEVLGTNIAAMDGLLIWTNSALESTPLGRWRIILEGQEDVTDVTESVFKIRNGPILYYVNDDSLDGDMFTIEPGSPLNNGITVSTPVHSVETVINGYQLEAGDVVYIDTGFYMLESNIVIRVDDSGAASNLVWFIGSTNRHEGGTRFYRTISNAWQRIEVGTPNAVFEMIGSRYLGFRNLLLENANSGMLVNNPSPVDSGHRFERITVRHGGYYGFKLDKASGMVLDQVLVHNMAGVGVSVGAGSLSMKGSILWSNQLGAISGSGASIEVTNSVLHAFGPVTNAIYVLSSTQVKADYNSYLVQGEASYAVLAGEPISGLPQWSLIVTQDFHTLAADPLFADPANTNFYLSSPAGRYDPFTESFVTSDLIFSSLIDAGAPTSAYGEEPEPNGARRNIGLFGNTAEASMSRSEPWLLAVTAMNGGRAEGIFPLHWFFGNIDVTNRVHLDFSVDGGTNWHPVVSNLLITTDGYLWNSLNAQPINQSPISKWRVTLAGATNVFDETDGNFGLNGPFRFYVNDGSLVGDEFTTAMGNDNNLGIYSNAPKATLRATLDTWDIEPNDFLYIDTGTYVFQSNDLVVVRLNNRGSETFPVTIMGSSQGAVLDGTVLAESSGQPLLIEIEAPYVHLDTIILRQGSIEAGGTNIVLRNMDIQGGSIQLNGQFGLLESFTLTTGRVEAIGSDMIVQNGYALDSSFELSGARASLYNSIVAGDNSPLVTISGTNVSLINNTLVAERTAILQEGADSRSIIMNNIIVADGAAGWAFAIDRDGGVVESDFNLFEMRNGAWFGRAQEGLWEKLIYWQQQSGNDLNSIAGDPLFADESAGDYHLKSIVGRYDGGTWVTDVVHSAAIDSGSDETDYSAEPVPNGQRVNIGAYGNTAEASKGRDEPWLLVMTMNDAGVVRGTNTLSWLGGSLDATNRVYLQYSYDAGTNWVTLVGGLPALGGSYLWDSTTSSNSLDALWRVVLEADSGVSDVSDSLFNVRNDVRSFYVNNASTNGNVYTTAPGSSSNDGRTPATPKASIEDILATYDTEPFDTIYVDTGIYTSSVIQVIWSRGGDTNGSVTIRGSTNTTAGGTVIRRPALSGDALVIYASYFALEQLIIENSARGVYLETNNYVRMLGVELRNNRQGAVVTGGRDHAIVSSRVWNNSEGGLQAINTENFSVENITAVNNTPYVISLGTVPGAVVQNSIFYQDIARSNSTTIISGPVSTVSNMVVDYNVYFFGTLSASNTFIYSNYNTNFLAWQLASMKDLRSAFTNPELHNVASGDFHLKSVEGRYDPATGLFTNDAVNSWALDRGNPFSDYSQEPADGDGTRINIGAYGNTPYASKSQITQGSVVETWNDGEALDPNANPYLLEWWSLDIPTGVTYQIEYTGDNGASWTVIASGIAGYQEYYIWTNTPSFNSFNARWRLVGEGSYTNYGDINDDIVQTFMGYHAMTRIDLTNQVTRVTWRAAWGEDYQPQVATNFLLPEKIFNWENLGPITNLTVGGDVYVTDPGSTNPGPRFYRVYWQGTNSPPPLP